MRTRYWLGCAMIVVTAILAPGIASGALTDCANNRMCLWGNNDFKWKIGDRAHGNATIVNLTGDANDEMDSWANRSASYTGCGFANSNGSGDRQTFGRASSDNNVNVFNSDEVSSWRTKNGC